MGKPKRRPIERGKSSKERSDLLDRERERRRRLSELRAAGRREGRATAEKGRGAEVPEESAADRAAHLIGLAHEAAGYAAEFVPESVGAGKVGVIGGLGGVAAYGVIQGRAILKAIHEVSEGNARESVALGVRHGLSRVMADANNPESPHIRDGKPYTKEDLRRRVSESLASDRDWWMPGLKVENSPARKQYDSGIDSIVDHLNAGLQQGKTALERQAVMKSLTQAAAEGIADRRRQWQQQERPLGNN